MLDETLAAVGQTEGAEKQAVKKALLELNEMLKEARLQEHQQRVVDKLDNTDNLLVYHGLGSGKTLTALTAADQLRMPATVVGPASLRSNFLKEKRKHHIKAALKYYTYNKPPEDAKGLVVFDEAHRMGRVGTQRSEYPDYIHGDKNLFLTGTPIRNNPSELIPLMRGLGIGVNSDPKWFADTFIDSQKQNPGLWGRLRGIKPGVVLKAKNLDRLKKMLRGKVDYQASTVENYPSTEESNIEVEMTPVQEDIYRRALRNDPDLQYKVEHGIAPSKSEAGPLNSFLSATRQISNFPGTSSGENMENAPKMKAVVDQIRQHMATDPNYRGVTYSNYISHGVEPIKTLLDREGISSELYTGQLSQKKKDQVIKDYNKGRIKQLLLSGAGSEGLDLKGTKLMQILEPHWNQPQLDQVKGRAVRYMSHDALPENERKVEIQNFLATLKPRGFIFKKRDTSSDQYLQMLSKQKTQLNQSFLDALQEVGSESADDRQQIKKALVELSVMLKESTMSKQVPVDTVPLYICDSDGVVKETLTTEMADTKPKQAKGMMGREDLPEKQGMLFTSTGPFWMKGVNFDLDLIFLDKQGCVTSFGTMKQGSPSLYFPDPAAQLALEVRAGTCQKLALKPGDRVKVASQPAL